MATLTIRRLNEAVKRRLRLRAAEHGHSMEEEARLILQDALAPNGEIPGSLYQSIRQMVDPLGGMELDLPPRDPGRVPPTFDDLSREKA